MAYNFGPIVYTVTTKGLTEAQSAAQSINSNMAGAAASASKMGKAASGALNSTAKGTFGESVAYGQARGSTGQTGASARDFANQAQGLGGLVRLYATFAANIFAVGAAFEALKRSFQFEQLQKASDAFAVTTGKNLSGLSAELKKLSQGTLTDKAAQQMANYGTSAGFTSDQMRRIISVAKGASQALGRDMGDAIDRLMRGAGKLNPELLDELGLLTRTKAAYAEYGKAVGKSANDLTGFEKTQAFTNAILKEGEEKFSAVSKAVDASPFERFTASLLTMGTTVGNIFNKVFVPILDFFSNNPSALIAAMAAAFGKLLLTALPALNSIGEGAHIMAEKQTQAFELMKLKAIAAQNGITTSEIQARQVRISSLKEDVQIQKDVIKDLQQDQSNAAKKVLETTTTTSKALDKIYKGQEVSNKELNRALGQSASMDPKAVEVLKNQVLINKEIADGKGEILKINSQILRSETQIANLASADPAKISKSFTAAQNRAALSATKAEQLAGIGDTTTVNGVGKAYEQLKNAVTTVNAKYIELNGSTGVLNNAGRILSNTTTAMAGAFRIASSALGSFLSTAQPWLIAIGLAVAAFEILVSVTGGVNKKLEELQTTQENFVKALSLTGEQVLHFEKLQTTVDGSAESFLKIKSYSTGMFTSITEGLATTTKAFADFNADSSGWWSTFKEGFKGMFGMDTAMKTQVSQLRSSIYAVLASVSPEDQKKTEQAIISALPSASSLEQVYSQLAGLSSAQLTVFGTKLTTNLAQVNAALKYNEENIKNSISSWKSLGDAVDKYNDKEVAKDPKLKGIVESLHSINLAYAAAKTEKEKALVLSGLDVEVQDNLVKLAKERGINLQAWTKWIDEARASSRAYAEEEKAAADQKKAQQEITATQYISKQEEALATQKAIIDLMDKRKNGPNRGENQDIFDSLKLKEQKEKLDEIYTAAAKAARESKDAISESLINAEKLAFDTTLDAYIESLKPVAEKTAIAIAEATSKGIAKGFADNQKKLLNPLEGFTQAAPSDIDRETRKMKSGGLGRSVTQYSKDTPGTQAEKEFAAAKALKDVHEKIAKSYEMRIAASVAEEARVKRIADIEKETIGFVDAQTATEQEKAGIVRANWEFVKRTQELRIEYDKAVEARNPEAKQNLQDGVNAAKDTRTAAFQTLSLETLRSKLLREKVQYEKLYLDFAKEALSVTSQIADIERVAGRISEEKLSNRKSDVAYQQSLLDIAVKQQSLDSRKEVNLSKGPPTPEAEAIFAAEQGILNLQAKRASITRDISNEVSRQKTIYDTIAEVNGAIANTLGIQLKYSVNFLSNSANLRRAQIAEGATAMQVAKSYKDRVSALGLQVGQEDELILREEALLDLTDKIYQQRVQMYELNAKDGSGADFMKTIGQGFTIEAENFKKSMKSAVQTVVDGTLAAIDAPINYIVETLKGGGKLNASAMMKTIADSIKGSLFEYAGNTVKSFARSMLSSIFGDKSLTLQQVTADAAKKFSIATTEIAKLNTQFDPLIAALNDLASILRSSTYNTPAGASAAISGYNQSNQDSYDFVGLDSAATTVNNFDSSVQSGMDSVGDFGDQMNKVAEGTAWGFGKMFNSIAGWLSSVMNQSGAGQTVGSMASGAVSNALGGGAIGNTAGSIATSVAGSALTTAGSAAWAAGAGAYGSIGVLAGEGVGTLGTSLALGLEAGLAAIPVAGWVALGAIIIAGVISGMDDGPAMRSGKWSSSTTAAATGAPLGTGNPLFQGKSAFGAFGVTNDKWFSDKDMAEPMKQFLNNITTIDNIIAGAVGPEVTAKISANLAAVTTDFEAGMEHEGVTFGSILINRYKTVLNTVDESLGSLLDGFEGTGQEMATFVVGLISMNKVMKDASVMNKLFGESFSIDALKEQQKAGELITDTFTRLSAEFNITNQVADMFGLSIEQVFGNIGLAGTKMREELIAAAGGIDALTAKTNFFYENFFTDQEKRDKQLAKAKTDISTKLGADAPTSKEAYKSAVSQALIDGNFALYNSLLDLGPAFKVVFDASELLTANTLKLNDTMGAFNVTFGEDFVAALDKAGISIDKFISDSKDLASSMLSQDKQDSLALANANSKVNSSTSGYLATTGHEAPKSREDLWNQYTSENDPVKKAAIASWWKDWDVIFDAQDKLSEKLKQQAADTKLVEDAAQKAGITLSDTFIKSLLAVDGAAKDVADQLGFFVDQFLTDADKTKYATEGALSEIGKSGLQIPKTRAEFVKYMGTLSESQKLVALKLLPAYDALYDAEDARLKQLKDEEEAITGKVKAATGVLYTEPEQKALALVEATATVNEAFAKIGQKVPTTAEGFRTLYNSLDSTSQRILLDIVPAFGTMIGAVSDVATAVKDAADAMTASLEAVASATGSFMDDIEGTMGTAEERYNTFKARSEVDSTKIDDLMKLNDDELKKKIASGELTTKKVEDITSSAVENAKKAWSQLTDDQKQALGPAFLTYIAQLEKNATDVIKRVGEIAGNLAGTSLVAPPPLTNPGTPTSRSLIPTSGTERVSGGVDTTKPVRSPIIGGVVPDDNTPNTRSSVVATDPGSVIINALSTGSVTAGNTLSAGIRAGSIIGAQALSDALTKSLKIINDSVDTAQNNKQAIADQLAKAMQVNVEKQEQVVGQQQTAMADFAAKLLDAAQSMLSAAAGQQAAANTPQKIEVAVDVSGLQSPHPSEVTG